MRRRILIWSDNPTLTPRSARWATLGLAVFHPKLPLFLLLAVFAAAGCTQPEPVGPNVNLSGYSQAFKDGWAAGCKTARGRATKDDARMRSDVDYRQGWEDGSSVCSKR
jgi:hypothetical protein